MSHPRPTFRPGDPPPEDPLDADRVAAVSTELQRRAFLHDDPVAYQAGVRDALIELGLRPRPGGDATR